MTSRDSSANLPSLIGTFLDDELNTELRSALLAVSGGRDSMVLLDAFVRGSGVPTERIHVLHYNHRLHEEADRARDLVKTVANCLDVSFVGAGTRDPETLTDTRRGLEAEAREHRYGFFESVSKSLGVPHLFLAHHRLDQVETILLDLGRGAGPGGLTGMGSVANRSALTLCRPFLEVEEPAIRAYAKDRDLEYVEDPTNEDVRYARNRLRNQILPAWRKAQPDPDSAVVNHARRNRLENDFWEQYLEDRFRWWVWPDEVQVDREQFRGTHLAVQLRYLHFLCTEVLSLGQGFDEGNYRDLCSLLAEGRSGARLSLPGEVYGLNEYERGCISTRTPDSWSQCEGLNPPGQRTLDGVGTLRVGRDQTDLEVFQGPVFYSRLRVPAGRTVTIRSWSRGDRYEDEQGLRKLKKLFSDGKVPYRARRLWPLLVVEDRVRVVPGLHEEDAGEGTRWWVGFRPDHPTFDPLLNEGGGRFDLMIPKPGERR